MELCNSVKVDAFNKSQADFTAQDSTHLVRNLDSLPVLVESPIIQQYLASHPDLCAAPAVRYASATVESFTMPVRSRSDAAVLASAGEEKAEGGIPTAWSEPIYLGALDKSLIDDVIRENMPTINWIYTSRLKEIPGLAGKVNVKFVIEKDGRVGSAEIKFISQGLDDEKFKENLLALFTTFEFPAPQGRGIVVVSYPFSFGLD